MNDRLLQFLAAENISQSQFADTLGITRASVSHVLAGRNRPSYDFIASLMEHYPALNIEWLVQGRGKMYKGPAAARADDLPPAPASPLEEEVNLFSASPVTPSETPRSVPQDTPKPATTIPEAMTAPPDTTQNPANQRRISKVILFFDDASFQEIIP